MNNEQNKSAVDGISFEDFTGADAVIAVTYDSTVGGFKLQVEGNELLPKPVLARVLMNYAQRILQDQGAQN